MVFIHMGFPINVQEFENYINQNNFNRAVFDSKIFYFAKCNFALLAALEDFVSDCDKSDNAFIIESRKLWLEFLQIYYYRFNYSRNILKSILMDGIVEERDIDFTNESLYWTLESIKSLFKDDVKQPLHFAKIIFAGRFYASLHFYIGSIDSYCEKKLNLVEQYIKSRRNLKIIEEERQWIDSLYQDIQQRKLAKGDIELSPEIHDKLTNMWYRTLDFVSDKLLPEFQVVLSQQK